MFSKEGLASLQHIHSNTPILSFPSPSSFHQLTDTQTQVTGFFILRIAGLYLPQIGAFSLTGEQKVGKGGVGLYKNVYMHIRKSTRTVQKRSRRKIERKKKTIEF
jgi:hypothetical protein